MRSRMTSRIMTLLLSTALLAGSIPSAVMAAEPAPDAGISYEMQDEEATAAEAAESTDALKPFESTAGAFL